MTLMICADDAAYPKAGRIQSVKSSSQTSRRRRPYIGRIAGLVAVALLVTGCSYQMPDVSLDGLAPAQTSYMYAADGTLLTDLYVDENREVIPLNQIPKVMQDAVIAIEDERFWEHNGVDYYAIGRAVANNATGDRLQGASTITQQLVKQKIVGDEQTAGRKVKEATYAISIERTYSKERILEEYLNTVYFGNGAYGVQAAAKAYFNIPASQLNLAQSALLAGIIRSPINNDPTLNPDNAAERRNLVLRNMAEQGKATPEESLAAQQSGLSLTPAPEADQKRYPAPFFVEAVKRFVLQSEEFGTALSEQGRPNDEASRRDLLFRGGIKIYTTLDLEQQATTEAAVNGVLNTPKLPDAAVVVLDPTNGEVKSFYGGDNFWEDTATAKFDLATQGKRQAGSSFKPFVLAKALEDGMPLSQTYPAPNEIEIDLPGGGPNWSVKNADGRSNGSLDLITATARSVNTVYAQLMVDVGPEEAMAEANKLGIQSKLTPNYAAVLGTNSVSPLEMASAYGSFANRGVLVSPTFVRKIVATDGTVLYEHSTAGQRVMQERNADAMNAVLQRAVTSGTGKSAALPGREVAGKTGTATEYRDAWFVGYTPQLVTSVWVGYAAGQIEMKPPRTPIRVTGGSYPAKIWRATMSAALAGTPSVDFVDPPKSLVAPPQPTGVPVPDVVGLAADDADATLTAAGFVVKRTSVQTATFTRGNVVTQSPGAGASAATGSTITIAIADPDGLAVVPDVIGITADEAAIRLTGAGFGVSVITESEPTGAGGPGNVWRQTPGGGTAVGVGATVVVTINPTV